jgi:predicted ATP-grasp superfamily ATP-dependent carboligase
VSSIDAFADLDLPASVTALSTSEVSAAEFSPRAATRLARSVPSHAVVYASGFEHDPGAVDDLAAARTLWGNPSSVLRRVRDPHELAAVMRRRGFAAPAVWTPSAGRPDRGDWLVKPLASGGGHGVRRWTGADVPRRCYLQERLDGVPGSIVFAAAGGRAVALGVSRQIVGESAFGASGYRYCGSILVRDEDVQVGQGAEAVGTALAMAQAAAEEFGLTGVNGIDFVADAGVPRPVELNPRWCASMELVERAYGISVFGVHAGACAHGTLPAFDLSGARRGTPAAGKAIVFAREPVTAGDTRRWLGDESVRDIPRPGTTIARGGPICTVFAEGRDAASCCEGLVRRAARVYEELERT